MDQFDAIIIGGGLGGVATGAFLANAGKRVLILERGRRIGGRAGTREIHGQKADIGVHGAVWGNHIFHGLEEVGEQIEWVKSEPDIIIYDKNTFFELRMSMDELEKFEYVSKEARDELMQVMSQIKSMTIAESEQYDCISLQDWLRQRVTKEEVYNLIHILGMCALTTESPESMAAGEVLRVINVALREGLMAGYPKEGGFIAISEAFARAITKAGGEIRTNTRVLDITVRKGTVRGVMAESNGELVRAEAPVVVSNVPIYNLFRMISPNHFPRWFVERIYFLDTYIQHWTSASVGMTVIASKPLHTFRSIIGVPSWSENNRHGPRYSKWIAQQATLTTENVTGGKYLFQYGNCIPRNYVEILRSIPTMRDVEMQNLANELWDMFPDFDHSSIEFVNAGLMDETDTSMKFPGNAWKQRIDNKAPGVNGLYFAGDTVKCWGMCCDGVVNSAKLCADSILGA